MSRRPVPLWFVVAASALFLLCGAGVIVILVLNRPAVRPQTPVLSALCQFDGPTVPGQSVYQSTTVAGHCSTSAHGHVLGVVSERVTTTIPPGTVEVWISSSGGVSGGRGIAEHSWVNPIQVEIRRGGGVGGGQGIAEQSWVNAVWVFLKPCQPPVADELGQIRPECRWMPK